MSEQVLNILKLCLLALVYLFLLRVLRAVWAEMSPPAAAGVPRRERRKAAGAAPAPTPAPRGRRTRGTATELVRSEEHTSELQSLRHLVCRLLLEKKNQERE